MEVIMPKLILHIGTEKTGTTSIQDTLYKNHDALLKDGLLYPKCFGRANHVELTVISQDISKQSELYAVVGLNNPKLNIDEYRLAAIKRLKQEIVESKAHTVILSNEHLHSRLTSPLEIERLKNELSSIFEEIIVVAYFREQLGLALSHFSTKIKSGDTYPFSLPTIDPIPHYYDYDGMIKKWEAHFSKIVCREFSKNKLFNQDVILDFLSVVGYENKELIHVTDTNRSIGYDLLEVLRRVNEFVPLVVDGEINPVRKNLVSVFEAIDSDVNIPLTTTESALFRSAFTEGNSRLNERYEFNGEIFNEKKDYSNNAYELNTDDFSFIFSEFWKVVKKRIDWKNAKISELQGVVNELS